MRPEGETMTGRRAVVEAWAFEVVRGGALEGFAAAREYLTREALPALCDGIDEAADVRAAVGAWYDLAVRNSPLSQAHVMVTQQVDAAVEVLVARLEAAEAAAV